MHYTFKIKTILVMLLAVLCDQITMAQGEEAGFEIVEFADRLQQYGTVIGYSEPYAYFVTIENENKTAGVNENIYHKSEKKSIPATWIQSLEINAKYNLHLYRFELRRTSIAAFPQYHAQIPKQNAQLRLGIDLLQDDEMEHGLAANYKDSLVVFEHMNEAENTVYKCSTRYGYPWSKGMPVIATDTKALVGVVAIRFDALYNQNMDVISILAIRDVLYNYANQVLRNKEFADCYYFNLPSNASNNESDCEIAKRKAAELHKKEMDDKAAEQRRKEQEEQNEANRIAYIKSLNREAKKNMRLSLDRFYTQDLFGEYRFLFDSTAKKSSWSLGTRSILWAEKAVSGHIGVAFGGFSQKTDSSKFDSFRSEGIASRKLSSRNIEVLAGISYGKELYVSATAGYISTTISKDYLEQYNKHTVTTLPNYTWMKYQLMFGYKFRHADFSFGLEYYDDLPNSFRKFTAQNNSRYSIPVEKNSMTDRLSISVRYSYRLFGYYGQIPKREASDRYLKDTKWENQSPSKRK